MKTLENVFPVTVNYDLSVESLVAQGQNDLCNDDITSKHFQTMRKGEVTCNFKLVHFNQVLTSDEVLKALANRGLRPAELHELLSFGIRYPEEQRKYCIVALGSVWQVASVWQFWYRNLFVPYLWYGDSMSYLSLFCFGGEWGRCKRFLAVSE